MATETISTETRSPIQSYLDHYGRVASGLPGGGLPWLRSLREAALARFRKQGFPNARVEAWRYTSLRPLEKIAFEPAPAANSGGGTVAIDLLPTVMPAGQSSHRMVFADGAFRADLSSVGTLPAGVVVTSLGEALASQ